MSVAIRADREGNHARLVATGPFDLAHATMAARAVENAEALLAGCGSVDVDLSQLERIDGAGAVLLARLLDRLDAGGRHARVIDGPNREAARLIASYRERRAGLPERPTRVMNPLTRIGALAAEVPSKANEAFGFIGRCAVAFPKAAVTPSSVDWRSLPRLIQEIGADGLLVTSAANLLIGAIIAFLGVSQLQGFGTIALVPQMVVVAHFRDLGPLVTGMIMAGRSGAGIASEIATMKVSEEVDALQAMGFDPVSWLVVPRCLALAIAVPLLTWLGDVVALVGGLGAAIVASHMTAGAFVELALNAISPNNFFSGLVKTPFLGLSIGLIACGQGLLTRGGAAAVGTRTTTAVVLALFSVIVINALFTFFYALIGI